MKLYNIDNVEEFMGVVDKCSGPVELVSPEGDRLNLKSELSHQLIQQQGLHPQVRAGRL